MRQIAASAPGKLILLGEYGVLVGYPAVVMAVDRRARVGLIPAAGDAWEVVAPGFEERTAAFELDRDRGRRWREPASAAAGRLALVERVLGSMVAAGLVDPIGLAPASITVDTRAFFRSTAGGRDKLGLGSSAALTVALAEGLRAWAATGGTTDPIALDRLLGLHRSAQGGRGSGIDLAASRHGGVVEYRLDTVHGTPSVAPLRLPEQLRLAVIWTGRPASTASFLARLDDGMQRGNGAVAAALAEIGEISTTGIRHLRAGDVVGVLHQVSRFGEAMEGLGAAAGMPIVSDEHRTLRRLAGELGVHYKPSGAGGGDMGLGFTDDPEAASEFAARASDAGFQPVDVNVDPDGVTIHESA